MMCHDVLIVFRCFLCWWNSPRRASSNDTGSRLSRLRLCQMSVIDLIRFRSFSADCCSSVHIGSFRRFLESLWKLDDLDDYCEVRALYIYIYIYIYMNHWISICTCILELCVTIYIHIFTYMQFLGTHIIYTYFFKHVKSTSTSELNSNVEW